MPRDERNASPKAAFCRHANLSTLHAPRIFGGALKTPADDALRQLPQDRELPWTP